MAEGNGRADHYVAAAVARAGIAADDLSRVSTSFEQFAARIEAMWAVPCVRDEVPAQTFEADPTFADWW